MTDESLSGVLGSPHGQREGPVSRLAAPTRCGTHTVKCPGPATVSDSIKPDVVGRFASSARLSAVSGGSYTAGDTIIQSPSHGALYDGDGPVAPTSRH